MPPGAAMMTPQDALALPQPPADCTVPYGLLPAQRGDLRLPREVTSAPLVVLLHGGCWEASVDRGHLSLFAEALRARGVASWNVEYRRVGEDGGGWPGTFDDARAALAQLPALAAAHPVDLSRVLLLGHSAGAHLALWLASVDPAVSALRGVLALAPLTDLTREHLRGFCRRAGGALVEGIDPDADVSRVLASPALMPPPRVPVRVLDAAHDAVVAGSHGERYLAAHPQRVTRAVIPDAGHFELIAPGQGACDVVLREALSLLDAG